MNWRNFKQKLLQPIPRELGLLVRLFEIALVAIILYIVLLLVIEFIINPGSGLLLD